MYYTGLNPKTLQPVYVAVNPHEKAMQRALIQYRNPKNYELVVEALTKAGRTDLIGFDKKCLVRPRDTQSIDKKGKNTPNGGGRERNSHRPLSKETAERKRRSVMYTKRKQENRRDAEISD